ncbi:MAG: TVP38/TMEM64 family protein [Eubacteriales bacterium]|nr:TVP38/TMEM64 family protein [Eubacteriales bacterium]
MESKANQRKKILKIVLLLVFLLVINFSFLFFPKISAQSLRDYFQAKGSAAAFYYILAFTILPAFFFPVPPLAVAAGLAFNFWLGLLYTLCGAMLNVILSFWLSRSLAREHFQALIQKHDRQGWIKNYLQSDQIRAFYLLLILRLIPLVPFTLLNYASGLGHMSLTAYLLATLIGILPGTMAMVNLGDKVVELGSPQFYLSVFFLVALIVLGLYAAKRLSKANHDAPDQLLNRKVNTTIPRKEDL